jgi:hypothetical protein
MTKELIKLIKGYGKWMEKRKASITDAFNEARESHYAWYKSEPSQYTGSFLKRRTTDEWKEWAWSEPDIHRTPRPGQGEEWEHATKVSLEGFMQYLMQTDD